MNQEQIEKWAREADEYAAIAGHEYFAKKVWNAALEQATFNACWATNNGETSMRVREAIEALKVKP